MLTVQKLADELGIQIEELVEKAAAIDPDVRRPESPIDEDVEQYVRDAFKDILKERRKLEREAKKKAKEKEKADKETAKPKKKKKDEEEAPEAPAAVEAVETEAAEEPAVDAEPEPAAEPAAPVKKDGYSQLFPSIATAQQQSFSHEVRHVSMQDVAKVEPEPAEVPEVVADKPAVAKAETPAAPVVPAAGPAAAPATPPLVPGAPVIPVRREITRGRSVMDELRLPFIVKRAPPPPPPQPGAKPKPAAAAQPKPGQPKPGFKDGSPSPKTGSETFKLKKGGFDEDHDGRKPRRAGKPAVDTDSDRVYKGGRRKKGRSEGPVKSEEEVLAELSGKKIRIQMPITVKELASTLGVKSPVIIKTLLKNGLMVTLNDPVPANLAELLGMDLGIEFEVIKAVEQEDVLDFEKVADPEGSAVPRAPVVAVLGHVDHGKTTLVDRIRNSDVAKHEAGGITQHVGAYKVHTAKGHEVVILDTPGHQAFSEMRARGANVTDIVILVVAADDGVMPQTLESIAHARAAKVPIVIAINKIDKANANPERIMHELAGQGLSPEEWGGDTIYCKVSAMTGEGMEHLLDMLRLQADVLQLRANPGKPAQGVCIDAEISEGSGVILKALVQSGTLRKGDVVLCGAAYGKVKAMVDDFGDEVVNAGPATPVAITGLDVLPHAGDRIHVLPSLPAARMIAEERGHKRREKDLAERRHVTLENLFTQIAKDQMKEMRVIIKADVTGSVEVLKKSLLELSSNEVRVKVLHAAVGQISESDVILADASDAIIFGFHTSAELKARQLAEERGVDIETYKIIYELINDVKLAMEGMLEPDYVEKVLGHAEVRAVFKTSRLGNIAGCYVTDGTLSRANYVRVLRGGKPVFPPAESTQRAKLASLRRVKDDVKDVREGLECGMRVEGWDELQEGDVIESYELERVKRQLTRA